MQIFDFDLIFFSQVIIHHIFYTKITLKKHIGLFRVLYINLLGKGYRAIF